MSGEKQGADMWLGLERVERKRFFFAGNPAEMCGICHKKSLKTAEFESEIRGRNLSCKDTAIRVICFRIL